jgi:hypothetical protein
MPLAELRRCLVPSPGKTASDYNRFPGPDDPAERAIHDIEQFGLEADIAIPVLREVLRHPDPFLRNSAAAALRMIQVN